MNRYTPELILAALLTTVCLAVSHFYAPGDAMSESEVDDYLQKIQSGAPMPAEMLDPMLASMRQWGLSDDGKPVHMLNLMRFHSDLQVWPGTTTTARTPVEANEQYEEAAIGLALPMGLSMAFAGEAQSTGTSTSLISQIPGSETWDRVLVVRYPSRRAFFELISDPEYLQIMHLKFAAVQLNLVPMSAMQITPPPSWIIIVLSLILLLAFGWWRAQRRGPRT